VFAAGITYYLRYAALIDARLRDGAFPNALNLYASSLVVSKGDGLTPQALASELQAAGYTRSSGGGSRTFSANGNEFNLVSNQSSPARSAHITLNKNTISSISANTPAGRQSVEQYSLGTPLLSTISTNREKRRMVIFKEIPRILVDAVVSIEDKRFFQHNGVDVTRLVKAAWVDLKEQRKEQGASTLTMQLVRDLWLEPEKRWKRKIAEAMMTLHLERRWPKEQIFETYANQIYLGRQGSYSVHGFGQAAQWFFAKDLREINLQEAALLAGIVQRPSYFNPFHYPDRARERRNLVLTMMESNGHISAAQRDAAIDAPLGLAQEGHDDGADAPFFTDLVSEELRGRDRSDEAGSEIFTTLDLNLQRAADEALAAGLAQLDKVLPKQPGKGPVQAALIAIDPHTGEIRALSGGRNYANSQLDRILAKRPPGSVFKPFVYAAALNTAVEGGNTILTPASTVEDEPTTFLFAGKPYTPSNFRQDFYGTVTLREAMAHSLNVAAVKVARTVGYDRVVAMARRAGMNHDIQATPAVALGAYDVTPLEIAGAYTIFANQGRYVKPSLLAQVRNANGTVISTSQPASHQALDPRVAWLMVSMLQEVMRSGTAAGVRGRGFRLPAGGKTGTSHDGWFAGFTSQLLCVVWVGYDDYRELKLEGAHSALPIWTDFMKHAALFASYRSGKEFPVADGVTQRQICSESGKLATEFCPSTRGEYFVEGTQPGEACDLHDFPTSAPQGP